MKNNNHFLIKTLPKIILWIIAAFLFISIIVNFLIPRNVISKGKYENKEIGFSLTYFKDYGEINFKKGEGTTGKHFFATQGCEVESKFCMFIGASTPDFTFPGELNASDVSEYPTDERLKILLQSGYKNEKKINSQGEEYVIIYGKKEVDMPYIGEGQAVAIFKLKSSSDFKAFGFMLVKGDLDTFLKTVNTIKTF